MNKFQKKLAVAIASSALMMNMVTGIAFAGVSCTISENGSDTDNKCSFTSSKDVDVHQNNEMDVDNGGDVHASTGGNKAEDNTGGDTSIDTGDADVDVKVETPGNTNVLSVP